MFSMVISQRSRTRPILFSPPITLSSSVKFSKPATGWRTPTHLSAHLSADVIDELESSLSAAIMGCVQSILMLTASQGAARRAVKWGMGADVTLVSSSSFATLYAACCFFRACLPYLVSKSKISFFKTIQQYLNKLTLETYAQIFQAYKIKTSFITVTVKTAFKIKGYS